MENTKMECRSGKPSLSEMQQINRYTRKNYSPQDVYTFSMILCNNEIDRDFEKFSVQSLKTLQKLYLGKFCILPHSKRNINQSARIYQTQLIGKQGQITQDGEQLIQLVAKAYLPRIQENRETIELLKSGKFKEISVSCAIKRQVCSICGREQCCHQNGKIYDGHMAYTLLLEPTDAYECSVVETPIPQDVGTMKGNKKIYHMALKRYGANSQILMVMEEMSELQKELCKNRRGAENTSCIAEEIADVEIMLEQMKLLFNVGNLVEKFRESKTLRLKARLEE